MVFLEFLLHIYVLDKVFVIKFIFITYEFLYSDYFHLWCCLNALEQEKSWKNEMCLILNR